MVQCIVNFIGGHAGNCWTKQGGFSDVGRAAVHADGHAVHLWTGLDTWDNAGKVVEKGGGQAGNLCICK